MPKLTLPVLVCVLISAVMFFACSSSGDEEAGPAADRDSPPVSDGDILDGDNQAVEDGDFPLDPDGDLSGDEDAYEMEGFSCRGVCEQGDPAGCYDDSTLCFCENGRFRLRSCAAFCHDSGLEPLNCRFDTEQGVYRCYCEDPPISCYADGVISSLPFLFSGNTSGAGDDFSVSDSCFQWQLFGEDLVFEIALESGDWIDVKLDQVSAQYDPALIVADGCSTEANCLAGSDGGREGENESLGFSASASVRYFIAIDSGHMSDSPASKGSFRLTVEGEMADGDEDCECVDGDFDQEKEEEVVEQDSDSDVDSETQEDEEIQPDGDADMELDLEEDELEDPEL